MKNCVRSLGVLCALLLLMAVCSYGQAVNATLLGAVTDSSGAAIVNAKVTATETNTGISYSAQTNESGNYSFPNLPPGTYSVTVQQPGFKKETRSGVDLLVDSTTRIDLALQPGNLTETIEVTGTPPLLETDRADTGRKVEVMLVENAPLGDNRNFQSLLNLVPGTAPATFQHSQFFNASSSLQTEVNGQLREGNNYLIEGTDDNERTGLLQILIPPIEAIQTVDVATSNFDAELGRASGAVTNVMLRSGTNEYHGAAYWYVQNSDFDARSFFNPSVAHIAYNYVGGNFGGAFKKNKLFFFGDYLRVMDHEGTATLETIPSPAFDAGNLSADTHIIYNPATGNNTTGVGRVPFAGNIIPKADLNPVSLAILALLPATNEAYNQAKPANNYYAAPPFQKTTDSLDYKMDYNISDKDRLSGRFSFARPVTFQAPIFGDAGGDANGAFEGIGTQKTYSAGLNYVHVFSPSLISEARLGIAHYHNAADPTDYGKDDATAVGIPGVNISPFTSGQVGINIQNTFTQPLVGYSASLPWIRAEANVDAVNIWTKIIRNHTFKVGADLRRLRDDLLQDQTYSPRGIYDFNTNQTSIPGASAGFGNAMASFLLDSPSLVGRDVNTYFPAYRAWQFFAFATDTWQVSSKLTINYGLRWELYPPGTPAFPGGFSNYDFANNSLVLAGIGGNPSNMGLKTYYHYFAPRAGIAYRLTEKTVFRAGYGISYTPYPDNTYGYNYPVRANNAYNPLGNGFGPAVLADNVTPATFQAGFPAPVPVTIPTNGIIQIPNTGFLNAQTYVVIPQNWKNPYVETWNAAVQQALPFHFALDVAYVANHGVDAVSSQNINSALTIGSGAAGEPGAAFKHTASVNQYFLAYSSTYNALQVKLDRRLTSGLLVTTSFTWGKALGYQSDDDGGLTFFLDQRRNYAPTDFDREFTYVQSYVYQLPFGPAQRWVRSGPASAIIGGWQLSGILTAMSGIPFYITANGGSLNTPGTTQTANQVGSVNLLKGINVGNPWFSTSSFVQPIGVVLGNVGRNDMFGPGLFGLSLALAKDFSITERLKATFRAEAFQVTNSPQFNNPQTSLTSPTFGDVTSTLSSGSGVNGTGGGRALQLSLKFAF